jgi:hypothetical protein
MNIIFLHIPRTGGGTFQNILKSWYLNKNCHKERSGPVERQLAGMQEGNPYVPVPQHKQVVIGHFAFHESFRNENRFLCTFIRHPVDWTVSRWAYHLKFAKTQPITIHELMDWGFTNMQSKYLKGSTLDDFNFIGLTHRFVESMKIFQSLVPQSPVEKWANMTDWDEEMEHQKRVFSGEFKNASNRNVYTVTDEEKEIIKERNQEDLELYEKALVRFDLQLQNLVL